MKCHQKSYTLQNKLIFTCEMPCNSHILFWLNMLLCTEEMCICKQAPAHHNIDVLMQMIALHQNIHQFDVVASCNQPTTQMTLYYTNTHTHTHTHTNMHTILLSGFLLVRSAYLPRGSVHINIFITLFNAYQSTVM